jgi:Tfp pilus assembly protein PilO
MNWITRPDRMWAFGGVFVAAALSLLAWTFLISPQRAETDELATSTDDTQVTVAAEQRRLDQLVKEYNDLAGYQAKLDTSRKALPTEAGLADFLRELQSAGDAAGVAVTTLNAGSMVGVKAGAAPLFSITVTVTAEGPVPKLEQFLHQLQQVQPRAALILNANLTPGKDEETVTNKAKLSISAQIFVAAPEASDEATPAASAPATTD